MAARSLILAFLGPSASGKSSVVRELERRGVVTVTPSWTTRPRRGDEADGTIEHRFVTDGEFDELIDAGYFLEVVTLFGLPYRYGLPTVDPALGRRASAIMVRAPLMPLVARHFPEHVAYQIEIPREQARRRLLAREVDAPTVDARLRGFDDETVLGRASAHRVFVNTSSIDNLVTSVQSAIEEDFAVDTRRDGSECPDLV
ncbi:MAG: hypothetical protein ACR2GF_02475 [Acidimicrobiales bacterium]